MLPDQDGNTRFVPIDLVIKNEAEIEQTLGQVLHYYPWYKDDQKNFPGATEADGVCTGEETAVDVAHNAAKRIVELETAILKFLERVTLSRPNDCNGAHIGHEFCELF